MTKVARCRSVGFVGRHVSINRSNECLRCCCCFLLYLYQTSNGILSFSGISHCSCGITLQRTALGARGLQTEEKRICFPCEPQSVSREFLQSLSGRIVPVPARAGNPPATRQQADGSRSYSLKPNTVVGRVLRGQLRPFESCKFASVRTRKQRIASAKHSAAAPCPCPPPLFPLSSPFRENKWTSSKRFH